MSNLYVSTEPDQRLKRFEIELFENR